MLTVGGKFEMPVPFLQPTTFTMALYNLFASLTTFITPCIAISAPC